MVSAWTDEQLDELDDYYGKQDAKMALESWLTFYRKVMAVGGGMRPERDYPNLPRPVIRKRGMELDLLADELGYEGVNEMVDHAWDLYNRCWELNA